MAFYQKLRIQPGDSAEEIAEKKRIAGNLLSLRAELTNHIAHSFHNKGDWEIPETDAGDGPVDHTEDEHAAGQNPHEHDSMRMLLLATWNIREFDSTKYGERLEESYYYIAEIISKFDLLAIQEVRDNLSALKKVMQILGPDWDFIATDVTEGSGGNGERMAFVYNRAKVWFRNIAGELVLPAGQRVTHLHEERLASGQSLSLQLPAGQSLKSPSGIKTRKRGSKRFLREELAIDLPDGAKVELPAGSQLVLPKGYEVSVTAKNRVKLPRGAKPSLKKAGRNKKAMVKLPKGTIVGDSIQFARTPAIVAFQSGWLKINLCTVHIYFGSDAAGLERRKDEIRRLTKILAKRAEDDKDSDGDSFFVALGDFNIISKEHETMQALLTNGFEVPDALRQIPRGSNVDRSKAYDQIAYWTDPEGKGFSKDSVTRFEVHRAGIFDFFKFVFREGEMDGDPNRTDEKFYRSLKVPGTSKKVMKRNWSYRDWRTHQMSDHLPMWIELRIDFGDEYLEKIRDTV